MKIFTRDDGRVLQVVEGFRERMLSYRAAVNSRENWGEADYAAAAATKQRRCERLLESFLKWFGPLDGATVLDVGCGDGANCLLLSREPVRAVVGIDLYLPLFTFDEKGERTRRLAAKLQHASRLSPKPAAPDSPGASQGVCDAPGQVGSLGENPLLPPSVRFVKMDATQMGFRSESFDVVMSRSAMEHVAPIEYTLSEMARVGGNGRFIYLGIDPFYWLRGCHKRGVVDIPWAHARLSLEEYRRFVAESEGESSAAKRCQRLQTLNRFTVRQWRKLIESMPCTILEWKETKSEIGEKVLEECREVPETLLPGLETRDLLCERIQVWLRKNQ